MPRSPSEPKQAPAPSPANPDFKVRLCVGADALTVDDAKKILGWEVVNVKDKAVVSELVPLCGQHVRLTNNVKNRYLTVGWLLTLRQEHLQKRWRFNGETIVISKTGQVLSGQHRLLSLIIAEIERLGINADHWREAGWTGPVTMETLVVYGIEDDDDTFKTLNCGKPGTLAEILFRSDYFARMDRESRKVCAGITDRAIKLLWHRTGSDSNPFAPRRTHGEAMDFLARHQRLLKAVVHVFEENEENAIGKYVDPGAAAGLMFLMASAESKLAVYNATTPPSQDGMVFTLWDKATEFWVSFAGKGSIFKHLKDSLVALADPEGGSTGSMKAKLILIVKAWLRFVANKPVLDEHLSLAYKEDEDGIKHLVEKTPSCGGIDLGDPAQSQAEAEEEDEDTTPAPAKPAAATKEKKAPAITAPPPSTEAKVTAEKEKPKSLKEEWDALKAKAKGRLLLFKRAASYRAFDVDAKTLEKVIKAKVITEAELPHADIPTGNLEKAVAALHAASHKLTIVDRVAVDATGTKEDRLTNIDHKRPFNAKK